MVYRFIYNNNDSQYLFACDEDAVEYAREELSMLRKKNRETRFVNVMAHIEGERWRWVGTYKMED